jgi:ribosome maturation factor RimP
MKVEEKQRVIELVEAPLAEQGFELADVVLSRYKHNVTVRLFVYGPDAVTIGDCTRLSRLVGDVIDGTDLFENGYALEVSSPGLDRPLLTARDFKYRLGETVRVEYVDTAKKHFRGEILAVNDGSVEFEHEGSRVMVDLARIRKATIVK